MFGPTGGLVANGPHVPMHLGSMQETVKYQVSYLPLLLTSSVGRQCIVLSMELTV